MEYNYSKQISAQIQETGHEKASYCNRYAKRFYRRGARHEGGVNYLETQEGKYLPVEHCIRGTAGWEVRSDIAELLTDARVYDKPTFGSTKMASDIAEMAAREEIELELIGLCTDICVVSNALLLKATMPEVKISVDPACCAGVTPESHEAALRTMQMCQIQMAE